jgi:hypothetical protein
VAFSAFVAAGELATVGFVEFLSHSGALWIDDSVRIMYLDETEKVLLGPARMWSWPTTIGGVIVGLVAVGTLLRRGGSRAGWAAGAVAVLLIGPILVAVGPMPRSSWEAFVSVIPSTAATAAPEAPNDAPPPDEVVPNDQDADNADGDSG